MNEIPYEDIQYTPYDTPISWWSTCEDDFDHLQKLAIRLFSVTPHTASSERLFSVLRWFYGQRRSRLATKTVENLAKIHTYYVTNAKKEFNYYGKDLSEKEVTSKCILSTMNLGEGFGDENDFLTDYDEYENINSDDDDLNIELDDDATTLKIEEIVDLGDPIFNIDQNNDNINENQEVSRNESTEYDVEELVSQFLIDCDDM
jgi:hypothetical protein